MTSECPRNPRPDLLEHEPALRAIARRILQDEGRVDDVVQRTWLALLRRRPKAERLDRWLGKVVRNYSLKELRGDSRRRQRERQTMGSIEAPSTLEIAAQREWSATLVRAVDRLRQPYREIVIDRYFKDLTPREISRRSQTPLPTVRSRLHKAHELLRADLKVTERSRWHSLSVFAFSSPSLWDCVQRGVMMKTKTTLGASAILLIILVGASRSLWWDSVGTATYIETPQEFRQESVRSTAPEMALHRTALPDRDATTSGNLSTESPDPSESNPKPTDAGTAFAEAVREDLAPYRGQVPANVLEGVVLEGRTPLKRGFVHALQGQGFGSIERPWSTSPDLRTVSLDSQGRFRFEGLPPGEYVIGVDTGEGPWHEVWHSVGAQGSTRKIIVLGASHLHGYVFDQEGRPLPGAVIQVDTKKSPLAGSVHIFTTTLGDGSYRVAHLRSGDYWVSVARDGNFQTWFSEDLRTESVSLGVEEERRLDLGRPVPLPFFEGRLVTESGHPISGPGTLLIFPIDRGYSKLPIDETGAFRGRFMPGDYELEVHLHGGEIKIEAPTKIGERDGPRTITLPGVRLRGTIARTDVDDNVRFRLYFVPRDPKKRMKTREIEVDGDHFVLDGLDRVPYDIACHPFSLLNTDSIDLGGYENERDLNLTLALPQ